MAVRHRVQASEEVHPVKGTGESAYGGAGYHASEVEKDRSVCDGELEAMIAR